jgi:ABC-2 type transport system permease protein
MHEMAGTLTVAVKELSDHFGSKRFPILFGLVLLLSSLTAYQGVEYIKNNTDAGFVHIFSGTQNSMFSFILIMVFFGPLLGLILGFDAINKERVNGTLSVLLGQPIYRDSVVNGKFLAGAVALSTMTVSIIGIMTGLAIPMLGFGPTSVDIPKIITLTLLTIIYLLFWLSLGILYSVLSKKISTSILASVATWLAFSIMITMISGMIITILVPLPAGRFRIEIGKEGFQSPEVMEALQKQQALRSMINKLSPTTLYSEAASDILGVASSGFGHFFGRFERTVTLSEALSSNWPNIATLAVGLVVCFAASYMMFLRSEIRPGE